MTKTLTIIAVAIATVGLLGWDLFVNFNKIEGDTISEVIGSAIRSTPILGVVLGVLVGHLCSSPGYAGVSATHPLVGCLVGVVVGFAFWNMGRA
jgi:hypothetical protein